jgi:hypothetical protein
MPVRLVIPVSFYDPDQSDAARLEFQEATQRFTLAFQMGEDLATGIPDIRESDYDPVSIELVRPHIRDWILERGLEVRFYLTMYRDSEQQGQYWCYRDLDKTGPKLFFSPAALIEIQDDDAALLFKLTWGGK